MVIVIGGANSNNTRELVKTCRRHCSRVYHVQTEADVRPEWFANVSTVGITAGTSTPDEVIEKVDRRVREIAGVREEDRAARGVTEPMNAFVKSHARWFVVVAFAVAMAWLESATVYYLRTLVDRIQPYQPDPLPFKACSVRWNWSAKRRRSSCC